MFIHLTLCRLQSFLALVDCLRGVFDHKGLVPCFGGVDCSALDAVVKRKAADKHSLDIVSAETFGQTTYRDCRLAERWSEARVCFNSTVIALFDDFVIVSARVSEENELGDKFATGCSLYAMVWPESDLLLFDIFAGCFWVPDGVFRYEWFCPRVLAGEGAVVWWVEIGGEEFGMEVELE